MNTSVLVPWLRYLRAAIFILCGWLFSAAPGLRAEESMAIEEVLPAAAIDSGDTAWMIVATVLVLFMTIPDYPCFTGPGADQERSFSPCAMLRHGRRYTILWIIYGYSVAFDTAGMEAGVINLHSFFGGLGSAFLSGIGVETVSGTIPESVFVTFQMTFAIITPALIVGAFAERMKFSAMLLFCIVWFTFSYLPVCHMAWSGDGALFAEWGVIDFAGGTVVHINAGIAGLVACVMVGKRRGFGTEPIMPHSVPLTVVALRCLGSDGSALTQAANWRRWDGGYGASRDSGCHSHSRGNLDGNRMDQERNTHRGRNGHRSGGRSCRNHTGIRLSWAGRRACHRFCRRSVLLLCGYQFETKTRL